MKAAVDFDAELDRLEARLGHRFERRGLLVRALTHRSFANERKLGAVDDNERLEFLGDALLGAAVAALLAEADPSAREGDLTRRRAELVREEGLVEVARGLELGALLRLGKGEERQGGREKPRLLASAVEAVFGAILLDAGPEVAFARARACFEPRVGLAQGTRDAKSRLQEWVQAAGRGPVVYAVVGTTGPEHEPRFEVAVRLDGDDVARGEGRTKLEAEQLAADGALMALEARAEQEAAHAAADAEVAPDLGEDTESDPGPPAEPS